MKRIVFVSLPLWPIERHASRHSPDRSYATLDAPLALIDDSGRGEARGLIVHACNARALTEGVREGEALADVRARVPDLLTRPADPLGDQAALEALASWCGRYGPAAATDGPRGLWIDITGVGHLFGDEAGLLRDLARHLASFGLTARLGLANSLAAAHAIAHFSSRANLRHRIATPADVASLLAPLPVEALRLDDAPLLLLRRLGLKRIGQLYALPRASLKRRFPARDAAHAVLLRLDQALGVAAEPLVAQRPPPTHAVRRLFAEPLISHEGLQAALAEAVGELCTVFAAHQIGARRLVLTLHRSDGTCLQLTAGFSASTCDPRHVVRLLGERLERSTDTGGTARDMDILGFGIDALVLSALRTETLVPEQIGLVTDAKGNAGSIAGLIDRLVNRLGASRVQRLAPRASHIPERAQVRLPALEAMTVTPRGSLPPKPSGRALPRIRQASSGQARSEQARNEQSWSAQSWSEQAWRDHIQAKATGPPRPCLLLSHPEPILVTAEIPEGPPARFTWRRVTRRIVQAQGPERVAPEWWRQLAPSHVRPDRDGGTSRRARTRDYYCVEDESGARYWVFRDGLYQDRGESDDEEDARTPNWFLHGLYA